jgi:hypothetical protein
MNISDNEKKTIYYNMTLIYACLKLYGINYRQIILQLSKHYENKPNCIKKTVLQFYTFISKLGDSILDNFHNYIYYDYENYIPSYDDLCNREKEIIYIYNSIIQD